jgi:threonine/homoserine/homoserine lactone efflux protein
MDLNLFIKGLIIGFSIAMPVGPIGLLCIRNVLTFGMICGLMTGLGAACADALYGALAGFGVTAVSIFLEANSIYLKMIGGLFLCYLGISTFLAKTTVSKTETNKISLSRTFLKTFFLTLTNPMTIISFASIYAGLGIGVDSPNASKAMITTLGVFLGSALWWLILSLVAAFFREKINTKSSLWIGKLSGSVIFAFGALALAS